MIVGASPTRLHLVRLWGRSLALEYRLWKQEGVGSIPARLHLAQLWRYGLTLKRPVKQIGFAPGGAEAVTCCGGSSTKPVFLVFEQRML